MVDRDKIEILIRHLREYTGHLRRLTKLDQKEFLNDPMFIGSARYYLLVSIESCIDIAHHIIATGQLRTPRDYKDTFKVLAEAEIIPADFGRTMQDLAGLRNLLVHVYSQVDDEMIFESLCTQLDDFDVFITHIITYLDQLGWDNPLN